MSVSATSSVSITENNIVSSNNKSVSTNKILLPSLASLLTNSDHHSIETNKTANISENASTASIMESLHTSFHNSEKGFIKLPPISINRPKLAESCLRHTASMPNVNTAGDDKHTDKLNEIDTTKSKRQLPTPAELFHSTKNIEQNNNTPIEVSSDEQSMTSSITNSYTTAFSYSNSVSSNTISDSNNSLSSSVFNAGSYDRYPMTPVNHNKHKLFDHINNKSGPIERTLNIEGAKIKNLITPGFTKSNSNVSDSLISNKYNKQNCCHSSNDITALHSGQSVSHTPTPIIAQSFCVRENDNNLKNNSVPSTSKKFDVTTPLNAVKDTLTPTTNEKKKAFAFITHSKDTFGVKEPKIDNAPLARRKRRRTSAQELNILQLSFEKNSTPDKATRLELANRCHMSEKAVQIWFQNKRQASKRQKLALENKEKNAKNINITVDNNNGNSSNNNSHNAIIENISMVDVDEVDDSILMNENKSIINNHEHSTPVKEKSHLATATPKTNSRKGQALTFHVRNEKKILTPVKISPNNKVNKLINNFSNHVEDNSNANTTRSPLKKQRLQFRSNENVESLINSQSKIPLKELNSNVFK